LPENTGGWILKKRKAAVARVITRMCRHIEKNTGRAPEGKALGEIEKRAREGAMRAEKRRTEG